MMDILKQAVSQFIESCGRDYLFPAGGHIEFLTEREAELVEALKNDKLSDGEKIRTMSEGRDWSDCYSIVIFGVRLAVMGVRSLSADTFRLGVLALAAGTPKVDWRDVLRAFAIFEDCGKRLGLDFQSEMERSTAFADEKNLRRHLDGFYSRDDQMRAIDVMGIEQVGDGSELTFKSKGMF